MFRVPMLWLQALQAQAIGGDRAPRGYSSASIRWVASAHFEHPIGRQDPHPPQPSSACSANTATRSGGRSPPIIATAIAATSCQYCALGQRLTRRPLAKLPPELLRMGDMSIPHSFRLTGQPVEGCRIGDLVAGHLRPGRLQAPRFRTSTWPPPASPAPAQPGPHDAAPGNGG